MKKKFISWICTLSMIATLFASFTVVNAAAPAVNVQGTKNKDNTVTLTVSYEGFTAVSALQFDIPVDNTVFEALTAADVKTDAAFVGVTSNPTAENYSFVWYSTAPIAGEGTAATLTLKLKDGAELPAAIGATGVKVADETANGTVKYGGTNEPLTVNDKLTDPNAPEPAKDRPAGNDEEKPAEAPMGVQVNAVATLNKDNTVTLTISYKGFTAVSALQFDIPVDNTVFEALTAADVKTDAAFVGVTSNPTAENYSFVWYSTAPIAGEGTAATLTLKLKDGVILPQTIVPTGVKVADETANGTVKYGGTNEALPVTNAVVKETVKYDSKTPVALKDKLDVTKIGADDAETNSPYYVVVTAKKADGTSAVYGKDYVAYYNGVELTEGQLTNYLIGKYGTVADAVNNITFQYNNGVSIEFELDKNGVKTPLSTGNAGGNGGSDKPATAKHPKLTVTSTKSTANPGDKVTVTTKLTNPGTDGKLTVKTTSDSLDVVTRSGIKVVAKDGTETELAAGVETVINDTDSIVFTAALKGSVVLTYNYTCTNNLGEEDQIDKAITKTIKIEEKKTPTTGGGSSSDDDDTSGMGPIAGGNLNPGDGTTGVFTDIADVPWALEAITVLASKGIINGRDTYTFDPNANITRAEYCQILIGAINKTQEAADSSFDDVASDAWYYHAVSVASKYGIVSGYGDGNFGPNNLITRQDMALMTFKAAQVMNTNLAANRSMTFADAGEISDYASEAVSTLANAGIINGVSDTEFAPKANATRAQAAVILYQTFVKAN